jgi:hypothetical protein
MRSIRDEDVSNHQLGRDLFGGYRAYKRIRQSAHVSLRTALKVRRFYRLIVADQAGLFESGEAGARVRNP